jgi:hypothetical protein
MLTAQSASLLEERACLEEEQGRLTTARSNLDAGFRALGGE